VAGQTTTTPTAPPPGPPTTAPGTPVTTVTAIGDSVMLGAYAPLKSTIDTMFNASVTGIDAAESRQFSTGVDLIQDYKNKGQLGQDVVVQLGTNGTVDPGEFDRMMGILSDRNKVVIINAKVPRPWEQQVNDTLAAGVKKYKNAVLLDWHDYGGAHPEFFYDDEIHLRPDGAVAYAQFVARAVSGERTP
jgi:lysophospholipase L1-like esterase